MKIIAVQLLQLLTVALSLRVDDARPDPTKSTSAIEIQINTYTTGPQTRPATSELQSGGSVVCWSSGSQDGDSWGVYCQIFDFYGRKEGTEFRANTVTQGMQRECSVCGLENGNFVVIWSSNENSGISFDVIGQMFSSTGDKIGSEFKVNKYPNYSDHSFSVGIASQRNGGFVVTRAGDPNFVITYIYAQQFSANGDKIGPEIRVADVNIYRFAKPRVAAFSDSGFVVVFEASDLALEGVYARLYTSSGDAVDDAFLCNSFEAYRQSSPSVGVFDDDEFVISWNTNDDDYDIYARKFRSNGYPVGTEKRIIEWSAGEQRESTLSVVDGNRFYVSWIGPDSDGSGIFRRKWNKDMQPVGGDEKLNLIENSNQFDPVSAAVQGGEGLLVVWCDEQLDGNSHGVFGRFFLSTTAPPTPNPTPAPTPQPTTATPITPQPTSEPSPVPGVVPSEMQINTHTVSEQSNSDSAQLTSGQAVVVWQSIQTGAGFDVFAQVFNADGTRFGSEFLINQETENNQGSPAICGLSNGGYVVVWNNWISSTSGIEVWGQRFSRTHNPVGVKFEVSLQPSIGAPVDPDIACQQSGGFIVTFVTNNKWIYAQMFHEDGQKNGGIRTVTGSGILISWPRITTFNSNNGFVIVWTGLDGPLTTDYGIKAQIYSSNGNRLGAAFTVNQITAGQQLFPDVSSYQDVYERFIVVWGGDGEIWSQRYTTTGARIQQVELQVNQYSQGVQEKPRVTSLALSSRLIITWEYPDGSQHGVMAREMSTRGHNYGEQEFQVNSNIQGSQNDISITDINGHYNYFITWNDPSLDGNSLGVFGRIISSGEGNPPPPPTPLRHKKW